ncbi:hypothetical protein IAT40_007491 [Kwoniella sp. CBS 6097]
MFPSSRRSRQTESARAYQKESPPTPDSRRRGDDSTYGVQSVSSWGGNSQLDDEDDDDDDDDELEEEMNDMIMEGDKALPYTQAEGVAGDDGALTDAEGNSSGGQDVEGDRSHRLGLEIQEEPRFGDNYEAAPHETSPDLAEGSRRDASPVISRITRPAHVQSWITPPSPEDTVHPLDRSSATQRDVSPLHHRPLAPASSPEPDEGSSAEYRLNHLTLDSLNNSNNNNGTPDSPFLPTSEPSSPASFTSMPSYVASLSSLSRTSSISPFGLDHYHHHHHQGQYYDPSLPPTELMSGGSAELVLPTLALPSESLSLHLSLPRWSGTDTEESGLSIVLLGEREIVEKTLRGLRERCEMVEMRGGVGLVKEGKVVVRINTAFKDIEQVQSNVAHSYRSLNRLIHPDLQDEEGQIQSELRRLVEGYASRSDWVHSVICMGSGDRGDDADGLVPTTRIALPDSADVPLQSDTNQAEQSPVSHLAEIEPTPRASDEASGPGSGYFAPRSYTPSPSPSRSRLGAGLGIQEAIKLLSRIHSDPSSTIKVSIDSFLIWRAAQAQARVNVKVKQRAQHPEETTGISGTPSGQRTMTSSMTSASSSYGTGGPMPTVARAQGGGEWEATLSRRVAQRRESVLSRDRERERARASPTFQSRSANRAAGHSSGSGANLTPLSAAAGAGAAGTSSLRGRGGMGRKRSIERMDRRDRESNNKDKSCLPPLFPTTPAARSNSSSNPNSKPGVGPLSSSSPSSRNSKHSVSEAGLGVHALLEKTFSGVRQWTKGWRGFVVVAVLVAVGWGCYASAK